MKLFHLTPLSTLDEVLRTGLDPSRSRSSLAAVFLAVDRFSAENYEGMKGEPCIVLEVELDDSFHPHLGPDNYELRDLLQDLDDDALRSHGLWRGAQWSDCSWQQSLAICGQVACRAQIPPESLRPLRPAFELPNQQQIIDILRAHPLVKLRETVERTFLIGSFAKQELGLGQIHDSSDVDVLIEVPHRDDETADQLSERYRDKLRAYFMKHRIQGRNDSVHPQWCGRRVDVYFTYDADAESRPKLQLTAPAAKPGLRR